MRNIYSIGEGNLLSALQELHAFNVLNDKVIEVLSEITKIDVEELCKRNGIVYDLTVKDIYPLNTSDYGRIKQGLLQKGYEITSKTRLVTKFRKGSKIIAISKDIFMVDK